MMDFWLILRFIDGLLFFFVALTVLYFLIFSIASLFSRHTEVKKAKRLNRFIILIPAYKDDDSVMQAVNSVLGQTYPQRMFDIVVISDHEKEMTNMRLAQLPITLLTPNFEKSSKAKSLQYAILNLPQFKIYDAVLILDADNVVEPEYLEQVNDAYEASGTKVIQTHRLSKNRDTVAARFSAVFEEINTSVFRRGHMAMGLSSALNGSGIIYDFEWFKANIMEVHSAVEDKELEIATIRDGIFIDFIENIHVYDEKVRTLKEFNHQRSVWVAAQLHALMNNLHFLPGAIIGRRYDLIDKILQWMLIPRTILMGLISIMSVFIPFIYFTMAVKWWVAAAVVIFAYSLATPDYLVDKNWDRDYIKAPYVTIGGLFNIFWAGRNETRLRLNYVLKLLHHINPFKKKG